jgi:Zn finger protein HypA/HybF involved in hydrogenase expression
VYVRVLEILSLPFMAAAKTPQRKRVSPKTAKVALNDARRRDDVAKAAGGPRDSAVYKCSCGSEFNAAVTTSVECPNCGSSQAW